MVRKLMDSAGASGKITRHTQQKEALQDADFVVVAFQIGGYAPCTVTDFEVCKRHGLEQTIADTLGPGGIMRALRTIPHLWQICEDMTEVCPDATMLNYVNPMAMNTGDVCPLSAYQTGRAVPFGAGERRKSWRVTSISTRLRCVTVARVSTIWRFTRAGAQNRRRQLRESLPGTAGGL